MPNIKLPNFFTVYLLSFWNSEMNVTDGQICTLSAQLPHQKYNEVCLRLGKDSNGAENILAKHNNDYKKAYHDVLLEWKNRILAIERYNLLRIAMHGVDLKGLFGDIFKWSLTGTPKWTPFSIFDYSIILAVLS